MAESATMAMPPLCLPPLPPRARDGLRLPAGSCDTHVHVFAMPHRHPLAPGRGYSPSIVTLADYRAVMSAFGIERAVLVQPSVYGFDNGALVEALEAMPEHLRGVAVAASDVGEAEFDRLHAAGVRAVRINRRNPGGLSLSALQALGRRLARRDWHVLLQVEIGRIDSLDALIAGAGVPVVIDHLGFPRLADGPQAPAFEALLRLAARGACWVKLSAPYRHTGAPDGYEAVAPFVARLVAEAPHRLLWASDWPHTECYDAVPDDADLVARVFDWLPDEGLRRQVLVDNPTQLYWRS